MYCGQGIGEERAGQADAIFVHNVGKCDQRDVCDTEIGVLEPAEVVKVNASLEVSDMPKNPPRLNKCYRKAEMRRTP